MDPFPNRRGQMFERGRPIPPSVTRRFFFFPSATRVSDPHRASSAHPIPLFKFSDRSVRRRNGKEPDSLWRQFKAICHRSADDDGLNGAVIWAPVPYPQWSGPPNLESMSDPIQLKCYIYRPICYVQRRNLYFRCFIFPLHFIKRPNEQILVNSNKNKNNILIWYSAFSTLVNRPQVETLTLILSRKPWPKESRVTFCLGHSVWG